MNNFLAINPALTSSATVPGDDPNGLKLTLRFWPPLVEVRLRPRLAGLSAYREGPPLDPQKPEDADAMVVLNERDLETYTEAARWGVAGWEGSPTPTFSDTELDGKKYSVLSDESIALLFRNHILFAVAQEAISFNVLTEAAAKKSEPS